MKKMIAFLFVFVLSNFCFAKTEIDASIRLASFSVSNKLNPESIVAVLEFSSPSKQLSEYIQTKIIENLMEYGKFRVVTRSHLDKVNRELNFHLSGYVSDETALDICKKAGASVIVFGDFQELDNKYSIKVKVLEVESAVYKFLKNYEFSRSSKTEQLLGRAAIYYKASVGIGAELNKNSLDSVAPGFLLGFDYSVARKVSLGAKILASYDFKETNNSFLVLESLVSFKWYLVSPSGEPVSGLFLEGLAGADFLIVDSNLKISANGGGALGYRAGFRNFYLEPEVRFGYPYIFGAGLNLGVRF